MPSIQLIHQFTTYIHIAFGIVALPVFWIPVLARKGSLDHKRFGRYFAMAMYAIASSGILMASLDLIFPLSAHDIDQALSQQELADTANSIRLAALFLLSLSILVFTSTRQGWLVINHKQDRTVLRTPLHITLCLLLFVAGLLLFIVGIIYSQILFVIFSCVELATAIDVLRYNFKAELGHREWWFAHLRGLIGSGIAAYTAFFVFGGSRFFSGLFAGVFSDLSIILWIGPGVIGGIAIAVLSRHYRLRFNADWAIHRAAVRRRLFS
jgi:uncharacterized membrane protein